eukprot:403352722
MLTNTILSSSLSNEKGIDLPQLEQEKNEVVDPEFQHTINSDSTIDGASTDYSNNKTKNKTQKQTKRRCSKKQYLISNDEILALKRTCMRVFKKIFAENVESFKTQLIESTDNQDTQSTLNETALVFAHLTSDPNSTINKSEPNDQQKELYDLIWQVCYKINNKNVENLFWNSTCNYIFQKSITMEMKESQEINLLYRSVKQKLFKDNSNAIIYNKDLQGLSKNGKVKKEEKTYSDSQMEKRVEQLKVIITEFLEQAQAIQSKKEESNNIFSVNSNKKLF